MHKITIFGLAVDNMQIKQNNTWIAPPMGLQWKQNNVWMQGGVIEYVLAVDADFSGTTNNNFRYIGTKQYIILPDTIKSRTIISGRGMFEGASIRGIKSPSNQITNMERMFSGIKSKIDLSEFNTSSATNMQEMFSLANTGAVDLSNFDTSNVKNMSFMFTSAYFGTIDCKSFNTSNVTNMQGMFQYANAQVIDVSSFDLSNVTNMAGMFEPAIFHESLETLYVASQAHADRFVSEGGLPAYVDVIIGAMP